jgi:hypothetical protein
MTSILDAIQTIPFIAYLVIVLFVIQFRLLKDKSSLYLYCYTFFFFGGISFGLVLLKKGVAVQCLLLLWRPIIVITFFRLSWAFLTNRPSHFSKNNRIEWLIVSLLCCLVITFALGYLREVCFDQFILVPHVALMALEYMGVLDLVYGASITFLSALIFFIYMLIICAFSDYFSR